MLSSQFDVLAANAGQLLCDNLIWGEHYIRTLAEHAAAVDRETFDGTLRSDAIIDYINAKLAKLELTRDNVIKQLKALVGFVCDTLMKVKEWNLEVVIIMRSFFRHSEQLRAMMSANVSRKDATVTEYIK